MTLPTTILKDRFEGCLLGLAIGDALAGKFEAQSADSIRARFPSAERLVAYPQEEIWYTDDTQMTIGISTYQVKQVPGCDHLVRARGAARTGRDIQRGRRKGGKR
jgi:ADP-ribosylglycohydrolase